MKNLGKLLCICFGGAVLSLCLCIGNSANAKSVFLPDWQETSIESGSGNDLSRDENFCATAEKQNGDLYYHYAPGGCPIPKVFDETCDHDPDKNWISECYCPSQFNKACNGSDERGDSRVKYNGGHVCDGLYVACCSTTCPSGYSLSHPGGCPSTSRNGCGDTCYGPYAPCCYPASDESDQGCGVESCSDGCGGTRQCAKSCDTGGGEEGGKEETGNGGESASVICGRHGYWSDPPVEWTCGTARIEGVTCYHVGTCVRKPCSTWGESDTDTGGCRAVNRAARNCYDCSGKQSCNYSFTADQCYRKCQEGTGGSCTKNGTTYYYDCTNYKCNSNQVCNYGTCVPK